MSFNCPKCSASIDNIIRSGTYFRSSDSKTIQRYLCQSCGKHFSSATFSPNYQQNKRRLNFQIYTALCSCYSQRRLALVLGVSRVTIQRKLKVLAHQARSRHLEWLKDQSFSFVQFDDLETFDHSKCKPLSVLLLVNEERKIIAFDVAQIPAKGHLTKIALKKYGKRTDKSYKMRHKLFKSIEGNIHPHAEISSDQHPQYKKLVSKYFPKAHYQQFKSARSAITGQGELKRKKFDPLFKINHTFAMLRANINRLIRRTWCTTKCIDRLRDHIAIYVDFHNQVLT